MAKLSKLSWEVLNHVGYEDILAEIDHKGISLVVLPMDGGCSIIIDADDFNVAIEEFGTDRIASRLKSGDMDDLCSLIDDNTVGELGDYF